MVDRNPGSFNSLNQAIPKTIFDAAGDLLVGSGVNRATRLAITANTGHVLMSNPLSSVGVEWASPSKGTIPILRINSTAITLDTTHPGFLISNDTGNSAMAITIPTNITSPIPIGSQMIFARLYSGTMSFTAASGVTLRVTPGTNLRVQYSVATLIKFAENEWALFGDLSA